MSDAQEKSRVARFLDSELFYNFRHSPTAIAGAAIVLLVILIAVVGPQFTVQNPYNMAELDLGDAYKPPFWLEGGDPKFLLGTNQQGRDMVSAMVYGSRVSLVIGLLGTLMASGIGIVLGLISGYFGGKVDALIMRTVRGETLRVKKCEYIEATHVIGLPNWRILYKHVLPNVFASIVVLSTIQVGGFILTEATLSFLGLGVPISRPSLGMLCNDGFTVLYSGLWWVSILPGLYIMIIVFGINLLGDFLRDEMNPKLK